jgi:hypothetical protein
MDHAFDILVLMFYTYDMIFKLCIIIFSSSLFCHVLKWGPQKFICLFLWYFSYIEDDNHAFILCLCKQLVKRTEKRVLV